jgi:thymidine kinase
MAKLYFRYGAMNSGKSTALLQVAHNYEERDQRVLLVKPAVDTKGADALVSRLGVARPVDFTVAVDEDIRARTGSEAACRWPDQSLACLLVDEAQFLTPAQVEDLLRIAVLDGVPVLAYGLRTDFQGVGFPGASRLLELAHSVEELKTICRCGAKATMNVRLLDGVPVFAGGQVAIDGGRVGYESRCARCYLDASGGLLSA